MVLLLAFQLGIVCSCYSIFYSIFNLFYLMIDDCDRLILSSSKCGVIIYVIIILHFIILIDIKLFLFSDQERALHASKRAEKSIFVIIIMIVLVPVISQSCKKSKTHFTWDSKEWVVLQKRSQIKIEQIYQTPIGDMV